MDITKGEVWRGLELGGDRIVYTPIAVKDERYQDVTPDGEVLVKKQLQKAEYKFYTQNGAEYDGEVYKMIDGEVVQKTEITKEVAQEDIKEKDLGTAQDLMTEKEYLIKANKGFEDRLSKAKDKCLTFPFNAGSGFKPSVAVVFRDEQLNAIIMRVGRVRRSAIVNSIMTLQAENQKAKAELKQLSEKVKRVKNKCEI